MTTTETPTTDPTENTEPSQTTQTQTHHGTQDDEDLDDLYAAIDRAGLESCLTHQGWSLHDPDIDDSPPLLSGEGRPTPKDIDDAVRLMEEAAHLRTHGGKQ